MPERSPTYGIEKNLPRNDVSPGSDRGDDVDLEKKLRSSWWRAILAGISFIRET